MKTQVISVCMFLFSQAQAEDWPTWRGVARDGISTETGLLKEWPEGGPKVIWTSREAGLGYSGYSVVGNRLFTMGADGSTEYLIALDANTGERIWSTRVGDLLKNSWGDGPRGTPAYSDGVLVALGGQGEVVCVKAETGDLIWKTDLQEMGGVVPKWGYSESPLIDSNRVLVTPGGSEGTVVCFDLKSGEKIWQSTDVTVNAHYSSIIAVDHHDQRQYIQLTQNLLFGLDADGKLLWETAWPGGRTAVIPTPIYSEGRVYITSGYGAGCMLISINKSNEVTIEYENRQMKNHHGGVILVDNHIYGYSDGPGWVCQNLATGELVWNEKSKLKKGAVAYADGMLYCLEERTGTCVLARATAEGWTESGRFVLTPQTEQRADKGKVWTHPVIANGRLYLRDQEIIVCYDISE